MSVGTVHRELVKFKESGILNSENLGNLRFFFVNKKNPLFNELKQMIFKTEGIKGRLEQELSGVKGIKAAFIYGSFAKDEERSDSDIDLFLIGDIDEDELISKISSLEKEFIREINYTIYTQREFKKEKKNKNSFVLEVIGDPKIFLTGGSSDL
jgi:predicted nucleotidyltransferase